MVVLILLCVFACESTRRSLCIVSYHMWYHISLTSKEPIFKVVYTCWNNRKPLITIFIMNDELNLCIATMLLMTLFLLPFLYILFLLLQVYLLFMHIFIHQNIWLFLMKMRNVLVCVTALIIHCGLFKLILLALYHLCFSVFIVSVLTLHRCTEGTWFCFPVYSVL